MLLIVNEVRSRKSPAAVVRERLSRYRGGEDDGGLSGRVIRAHMDAPALAKSSVVISIKSTGLSCVGRRVATQRGRLERERREQRKGSDGCQE
jgi:hypothetical protein